MTQVFRRYFLSISNSCRNRSKTYSTIKRIIYHSRCTHVACVNSYNIAFSQNFLFIFLRKFFTNIFN